MTRNEIEALINERVEAAIKNITLDVNPWNFGSGWTVSIQYEGNTIDSVDLDNSYGNRN